LLFGGLPLYANVREPYPVARPNSAPALAPAIFSEESANTFPALPSRSFFPLFGDREVRFRGLKLDAAACIEIATGEQQRRVQ
jgi:hypothetical protein